LRTIAGDPKHLGAEIGFLAVLHTWGQNLMHHPHVHCLVPGGGIAPDGKSWIACRPDFFLPVTYRDRFEALTGRSLRECPHCRTGVMVVIDSIARFTVCQAVPDTS
jgi:hypothetical protein